jgi:hypothetical protein
VTDRVMCASGLGADDVVEAGGQDFELDFVRGGRRGRGGVRGGEGRGLAPLGDCYGIHVWGCGLVVRK